MELGFNKLLRGTYQAFLPILASPLEMILAVLGLWLVRSTLERFNHQPF